MKLTANNIERKARRKAAEKLAAYDTSTKRSLGIVIDMSARGMKLQSGMPAVIAKTYYCRIPLRNPIDGREEVFFDAECRWCSRYEDTEQFYAGFKLRFPSPQDANIVQVLAHKWMKNYNQDLNARYYEPQEKKPGLFKRLFGSGRK